MANLISTKMAVHRHRQDDGTCCGRACTQMVISALTQTGPATDKVPVTQDALHQRELDKESVPGPNDPPVWYTHPDELVELLRTAPELSPGVRKHWRVAHHGTLDDLLDDLVKALGRGMPSAMNVGATDHWVVLIGAEIGANGLEAVHYLDPLQQGATTQQHTYVDSCSNGFDGVCCAPADRLKRGQLGGLEVEIGSVPPPTGLTDYKGRFVAIIHGPSPIRRFLDRLSGRSRAKISIAPLSSRPSLPAEAHPALSELAWRAKEWSVPALNPLLESKPELVDRLVRDMDGSAATYRLVALWSERLDYGLVAAFESDTYTMEHFRFTNRPDIFRLLSKTRDDQDDLQMTRRWLPSLSSPYYPFVRQRSSPAGDPIREAAVFTRLIDDFVLMIDRRGRVR